MPEQYLNHSRPSDPDPLAKVWAEQRGHETINRLSTDGMDHPETGTPISHTKMDRPLLGERKGTEAPIGHLPVRTKYRGRRSRRLHHAGGGPIVPRRCDGSTHGRAETEHTRETGSALPS